jgi:hypothetical protein
MVLQVIAEDDGAFESHLPKDHLIGSQRPCFISQHAIHHSQLLDYGGIQHSTLPLDGLVVHLPIVSQEQSRESLHALNHDVKRDGDEEVEHEEDGEEDERSCIRRKVHYASMFISALGIYEFPPLNPPKRWMREYPILDMMHMVIRMITSIICM